MRKLRTSVWFLLSLALAAAQNQDTAQLRKQYEAKNAEVMSLWARKDYPPAIKILEELSANAALMAISSARANIRYNLACGYSLLGQKDKALEVLRDLYAKQPADPAQIERDSDFDNIRGEPGYKDLIESLKKRWEKTQVFWNSAALRTPYRENLSDEEKIAGLTRFWAEAKYNFAWFEKVPDLDWDAQYFAYLPKVRETRSTTEYYRVLAAFASLLKDGHTNVWPPQQVRSQWSAWPAIDVELVEGKVVVEELYKDEALAAAHVERGTELVTVDGLPVREYAARFVTPYIGASSPQDLEHRSLANSLLGGAPGSILKLGFAGGQEVAVTRLTSAERKARRLAEPPKRSAFELRILDNGIAYVGLHSFGDGQVVRDFEQAWPEIRKAKAVIFDVRKNGGGNSGYGNQILAYFTEKGGNTEMVRTRQYRPAYRAWGNAEEWIPDEFWSVGGKGDEAYRGKVVLLTGVGSFSAAEDFAVAFDMLKVGTIIGEPTGGSTGQPLSMQLPGGGGARVCTLQCRYADGREFVGVGVQPHRRVSPTVADFKARRDNVLESAIAYLRAASKL